MKNKKNIQGELIIGMREAFKRNENVMLWAKRHENKTGNSVFNALVAYDLQSGSYVEYVQDNLDFNLKKSKKAFLKLRYLKYSNIF